MFESTVRSEAAGLSHQQPFALSDRRSLVNGAAVVILAQEEKCVSVCMCVGGYAAGLQCVEICRVPTRSHVNCSAELAHIAAAAAAATVAAAFQGVCVCVRRPDVFTMTVSGSSCLRCQEAKLAQRKDCGYFYTSQRNRTKCVSRG